MNEIVWLTRGTNAAITLFISAPTFDEETLRDPVCEISNRAASFFLKK